jgi:hypothetical protein
MLPAIDPTGGLTGCLVVVYTLGLIPMTLLPAGLGVAGGVYAAGAGLLGLFLLWLGVQLERRRTARAARRVFLASVIYLPLLLGLMLFDQRAAGSGPGRTLVADGRRVTMEDAAGGGSPPAEAARIAGQTLVSIQGHGGGAR